MRRRAVRAGALLDASDEIDVVLPPLAPGDDAAFAALYASVPGRGFMLLALAFANDTDGDGVVEVAPFASAPGEPGVMRLFVSPTLWIVDRPLVVVAGSQRRRDQRDGVLATNRVCAQVLGDRVVLPAFRDDAPAVVEGGVVTVAGRAGDDLVAVHGVVAEAAGGAPFRVLVGGDAETVDLARFGLVVDADGGAPLRVWRMDAAPTFVTGTLDVARLLAAPATAIAR